MMTASVDFPERNLQILRMSQTGMTRREIADRFGLTRNRVVQIVHRLTAEQELKSKLTRLGERIWSTDNLDAEWPVIDVLDALRLMTATRKALLGHLDPDQGGTISLRRLMDVATAEVTGQFSEDLYPKLWTVRYIGGKGYRSIIDGISNLPLGENCRREWARRLTSLKR